MEFSSQSAHDAERMENSNHIHALAWAPQVVCPGCLVEMTIRGLEPPTVPSKDYVATYRCPRCGTDTVRHFRAD